MTCGRYTVMRIPDSGCQAVQDYLRAFALLFQHRSTLTKVLVMSSTAKLLDITVQVWGPL